MGPPLERRVAAGSPMGWCSKASQCRPPHTDRGGDHVPASRRFMEPLYRRHMVCETICRGLGENKTASLCCRGLKVMKPQIKVMEHCTCRVQDKAPGLPSQEPGLEHPAGLRWLKHLRIIFRYWFYYTAENAIFTLKIAFSSVLNFIFISRQHFGSNLDDCVL
jgi:hypothetical protein